MSSVRSDALQQNERTVLNYIESLIKNPSEENTKDAIAHIKGWEDASLIKFSKNSQILNAFCETNKDLLAVWVSQLKVNTCPHVTLISFDKKKTYSIYQQYIAHCFFQKIAKKRSEVNIMEAKQNMDMACELGSYSSLEYRMRTNLNILKNSATDEVIQEAISHIMKDSDELINVFGGIGYTKAALIMLKMADFFFENRAQSDNDRGIIFFEMAIKNLLCAARLENHAYSNRIIKDITNGKGLSDLFKDDDQIKFTGWNDVKPILREWVGSETYEKLLRDAESEVKIKLMEKNENESACEIQKEKLLPRESKKSI